MIRAALLSLPLLLAAAPAVAAERVPAPTGFEEAFAKEDWTGALALIAPALLDCAKAHPADDACLDLLLKSTNTALRGGDKDSALTLAELAAPMGEAFLAESDPDRLRAVRNYAIVLDVNGQRDKGLTWHRKALSLLKTTRSPGDDAIGDELQAIARTLNKAADWPAAIVAERELLAWREAKFPAENGNIGTSWNDLALALASGGNKAEAELAYAKAQAIYTKAMGADHAYTVTAIDLRAWNLINQQRWLEAERVSRELIASTAKRSVDDKDRLEAHVLLGRALVEQKLLAAAEPELRLAIDGMRRRGDMPVHLSAALAAFGGVLKARNAYAEARVALEEAADIVAKEMPKGDWRLSSYRRRAAEAARDAHDYPAAVRLARATVDALEAQPDATPLALAEARQELGMMIVRNAPTRASLAETNRLLRAARAVLIGEDPTTFSRVENALYLGTGADSGAEARVLLAEAATGVHLRVASYVGFDSAAQAEMRMFHGVFTTQIDVLWKLANPAPAAPPAVPAKPAVAAR